MSEPEPPHDTQPSTQGQSTKESFLTKVWKQREWWVGVMAVVSFIALLLSLRNGLAGLYTRLRSRR